VGWALLIFGMEFPGIVALTDCYQRSPTKFAGGARDRAAWLKWLIVALFLMPIGVGYGILLGYHWNVIKRQPFAAVAEEDEEEVEVRE
jgi:hypothetical protein